MHRSRLALPVVLSAMAACSTHGSSSSDAAQVLSQDTALAHLDLRQNATLVSLPDACGSVAAAAAPTDDRRREAGDLTRQAYDAELTGDVQQAQSLLQRASQLDGTDKSIAYHLARTSESLGDRATATSAYCRYLTLNPTTAESMDARQRVTKLAQAPAQVVSVVTSPANVLRQRVARSSPAPVARRRVSSQSASMRRVAVATRGTASESAPMPARRAPSASTVGGEVEETRTSTAQLPAPQTTRRGPSRVQGAGIGAGIGAIMGAAAGRSVKGALIGAAAGGVLGTVVAGGSQ